MRRNQVSVVQLNPRRVTLEDAFLDLLNPSPVAESQVATSQAAEVAEVAEIVEDVVIVDED
jgi:hypothetical protein